MIAAGVALAPLIGAALGLAAGAVLWLVAGLVAIVVAPIWWTLGLVEWVAAQARRMVS